MTILGRILTILVGAAPATYLSLIAGLGAYIGALAVIDGEIGGLALVIWGGAGIFGTLSLWAVGFGYVRPWVVVGLVVGTVALSPLALMAGPTLIYLSPSALLEALTLISPIVVAVSWLGVLIARAFRRPRAPSTTFAART